MDELAKKNKKVGPDQEDEKTSRTGHALEARERVFQWEHLKLPGVSMERMKMCAFGLVA